MRNRTQAKIGVAAAVQRVLEGDLQKRNATLEEALRFLKAQCGQALAKYAAHLHFCPWAQAATTKRCTCGLHDLVAGMLPQERICPNCPHPIGHHIRTQDQKTYCLGHDGKKRCRCTTDPAPSVAVLDALVSNRPLVIR